MKNILIVTTLMLLITGSALAGSEYDRCIKEEKALITQERSDCSGLKYLLNPSGCFATRKALKEYSADKCRKIGVTENVDFSVPKVTPEKKAGNVRGVVAAGTVTNAESVVEKKAEREIPQQEYTMEQLKEENARLKAEINRVRAENEQLRKAGH